MTSKQKWGLAIIIVILLLIAFLYYYFVMRQKTEKCPDGQNIPESGNCAENSATIIPAILETRIDGCVQPSQYITNSFPLQLGMRGDFVKQAQIILNSQFQANLTEDGFFGCNTQNAIKKAFGVTEIDAQLFKDKIQTPLTFTTPV